MIPSYLDSNAPPPSQGFCFLGLCHSAKMHRLLESMWKVRWTDMEAVAWVVAVG